MKRLIVLLILIFTMTACSSSNEEKTAGIVFGEIVGENELEAINVFELGEKVNFLVETESNLGVEQVDVQLNIMNPDKSEWEKVTSSSLPTNPESNQIMNGLDGSIFEQLGPGAYQLEVKYKDQTVKGDFVVEE
ncbi:putative periplasmic lipoprotein [Lentibacillus cibarius]|uniref:DUF3221 domain-containing protein n=1 Tax=Lentibacillus cibarius TaxID=2583219 RepID=A0A5S3QJA4_9BACI|nr:hypothetical protein [Lentibacillus cibarius]TMN21945.1 hypothetical protein FFL34_07305 [Lentibacillus cibarius]